MIPYLLANAGVEPCTSCKWTLVPKAYILAGSRDGSARGNWLFDGERQKNHASLQHVIAKLFLSEWPNHTMMPALLHQAALFDIKGVKVFDD